MQQTAESTMMTATGWGTLTEGEAELPNVLHKVDIPVINDDQCYGALTSLGYMIVESMICAGLAEGGVDSCQGDDGGPFFLNEPGNQTILGVGSWSIGCGKRGYPGVYTEVSYFIDWIEETM